MSIESKVSGRALLLMAISVLLLVAALMLMADFSRASSHREAPLISTDPSADTTDVYAFVSPQNTDNVVLIGNWIPFEAPEGGPNYYRFDDRVNYDLHIDNDGDAFADITYRLVSSTTIANDSTFLYNTGPINSVNDPTYNIQQRVTVTEIDVDAGTTTTLVDNELVAPVNIGEKSTPDYAALAAETYYSYTDGVDTIDVFAGQRDDPFWVDLQVFDLLTLRGQDDPIGYSMGNNDPVDSLAGFNVHSFVVEVPISRVTANGDPVIGVWATSARAPMSVNGIEAVPAAHVQISRLGMPLVNEVVLPLSLKDAFNTISPDVDLSLYGVLQERVEDPEIGQLLCALYGVPLPGDMDDMGMTNCSTEFDAGTPRTGRGDIFDIFLTGMVLENEFTITLNDGMTMTLPAGFNVNRPDPNGDGMYDDVVPAEMLRLNTAISGSLCAPEPSRLGVLGGDACGFPNGRRVRDDVVEIELLAVAGAAYEVLDDRDDTFTFDAGLIDVLTDGIDENDMPVTARTLEYHLFPYLLSPHSGQEHIHDNPMMDGTAIAMNMISVSAWGLPMLEIAVGLLGLSLWLAWVYRRQQA